MLEVFAYLAILVGTAAAILWLVERIAKCIGGRNTWLLLLVGIPLVVSAVTTYLNRAELAWWQLVLLPLAGPVIAAGFLLLAYTAVNPFALIALAGALCQRARDRFFRGSHR